MLYILTAPKYCKNHHIYSNTNNQTPLHKIAIIFPEIIIINSINCGSTKDLDICWDNISEIKGSTIEGIEGGDFFQAHINAINKIINDNDVKLK